MNSNDSNSGGNTTNGGAAQHSGVAEPQRKVANDKYPRRPERGGGSGGEPHVVAMMDPRDSRSRKQRHRIESPPSTMAMASSSSGGGVGKINPTNATVAAAAAAAEASNSSSRDINSASVKFAMPAAFVSYEPSAMGPFSGIRNSNGHAKASSSRMPPKNSVAVNPNLQSGSNNNSDGTFSSGSLSSMGNNATGSSLSLSSDAGSGNHGKKKSSPQQAHKLDAKPPSQCAGKQSNFGTQSSETSGGNTSNNSGDDDVKAPPTTTSMNLKSTNNSSGSGSGSSGSGSDNNGGATSSSGNAAVVTTSTANNNTTSSGGSGDDRSSSGSGSGGGSGSGSGSGSGGNRRSAGEASGEYYYAGYGSSVAGDNHPQGGPARAENAAAAAAAAAAVPQAANNGMGMTDGNEMPTFASFQGAPLAAASAAVAAGPARQAPMNNNAASNMGARHVVVATDEPPFAGSSHLRHHSRHYHNHHRSRANRGNAQGLADAASAAGGAAGNTNEGSPTAQEAPAAVTNASSASRPARPTVGAHAHELSGGIPLAIDRPAAGAVRLPSAQQVHSQQVQLQRYRASHAQPLPGGSTHYQLRLPPSDEQAVLQRVPRTHATVVAHDVPPPPTSSDVWSSTSGSGGSSMSRSRKRTASGANGTGTNTATQPQGQPMIASVRLANGGTVDSVNLSDGSSQQSPSSLLDEQQNSKHQAMHVTMDDPILRKKISLKHQHQAGPEGAATAAAAATAAKLKDSANSSAAHKRKISAISGHDRTTSGDDSSDSAKEGSGSDEGYAASSEHQSGSGSDSISSDDAKKVNNAASATGRGNGAGGAAGVSKNKMGGMALAETSSMSSSVLADFSSVMNEEGTISLSRSESPRSSCTSVSSNGDRNDAGGAKTGGSKTEKTKKPNNQAKASTKTNKRDSTHIHANSANGARKRSKVTASSSEAAKKPSSTNATDGSFSSTKNNPMRAGLSIMEKSLQQKVRSASSAHHHHHYHSRSTGRKMLEKSFLDAKRDLTTADAASTLASLALSSKQGSVTFNTGKPTSDPAPRMKDHTPFEEASIYSLGQDVMAQVVQFLEPPEIHTFLTTPLSKTWLLTYTAPQELWKILCTSKPFYAKLDEGGLGSGGGSSDASTCSFPICNDLEMRHLFGRYRLLYTSFVRCMKYLNRLQDDALNGRTPTVYNSNGERGGGDMYPFHKNESLKAYFARARRLVRSSNRQDRRNIDGDRFAVSSSISDAALSITSESESNGSNRKQQRIAAISTTGTEVASASASNNNSTPRQRLGRSIITDRLLRPTQSGDVDNVNLPWSCAIYSVVNWMVAFADVEGIQIMCLKCLPYLLEDESQRTTAQRAGLTDCVLRAMVLFPDSIELHTVAFHTLVLLARPLGGNEGMLFHTAMVNTRGIFNNGSNNSKNGIVIMLDSMRRFAHDEILQAMSCWSLVNVALTPLQKSMLVKLGGLTVTSNAMLQHPYNAEVQFRALFALINLVIPTETRPDETEEMREFEREIFQQLGEVGETSEKEMLDASVGQISNLVVVGMKNFCSSEAILNRACLVLHNLSLNEEYHPILLWTPNCYQMLEWCLGNYPHDHVLQQSAGGTIQRLNATLSSDDELRARFQHSIRAQQQHSLELARQEAVMLQEQQREQEQERMDVS